jgi:hypothetical protein
MAMQSRVTVDDPIEKKKIGRLKIFTGSGITYLSAEEAITSFVLSEISPYSDKPEMESALSGILCRLEFATAGLKVGLDRFNLSERFSMLSGFGPENCRLPLKRSGPAMSKKGKTSHTIED